MKEYGKLDLIVDLEAMLQTFRFLHFCAKIGIDGIPDISKINTLNNTGGKQYVINGSEFEHLYKTNEGKNYLLGNCGAYLRAKLTITTYERVKGYCKDSTINNKNKFFGKITHEYTELLQVYHIIRHLSTHWNLQNKIEWKSEYPNELNVCEIKIEKGMSAIDVKAGDIKMQNLVLKLIEFVRIELD